MTKDILRAYVRACFLTSVLPPVQDIAAHACVTAQNSIKMVRRYYVLVLSFLHCINTLTRSHSLV